MTYFSFFQIKEKLRVAQKELDDTAKNTTRVETERDRVKDEFRKNKEALASAEDKYAKAKKKVEEVKKVRLLRYAVLVILSNTIYLLTIC